MSECSLPGSASQQMQQQQQQMSQQNQHTIRRASDPVRALDRNFGVTGNNTAQAQSNLVQSQRNRTGGSYNQLNNMQQQQMLGGRMPLHGQKIRGASGDSHFQGGMQHMQQPMNQGMMYESNSSLNSVQSMQTQNFQQQFSMNYNNGSMGWQQQQHQQPSHPATGNNSFSQQQAGNPQEFNQQTAVMSTNPATGSNSQFPANQSSSWQQWNNSSNWQAAANVTAGQQPPPQMQGARQQQQPNSDGKPSDPSYQRTFDYVQQCQNWTSQ